MTARDPNIERDVRAIVERIVDGLVDDDGGAERTEDDDRAGSDEAASADISADVSSIAVGADHGGFALKERIAFRLREQGYDVTDCGTDSTDAVDYPDFAVAVARQVADHRVDIGIMIDGAGIGSSMAANKVPGVRAALCYDVSTARNAREHNHANLLTLGAGLIGDSLAWQIVETFLGTAVGPGRHARRVALIDALDAREYGVTA